MRADFGDRAHEQGDKGAGLFVLSGIPGANVAPYRVVPTAAFEQHRDALTQNGCQALPEDLAKTVAAEYAALTHGHTRVLVRGSLFTRRPSCGQTYSHMVTSAKEAVEVARRVYAAFLEAQPPFEGNDSVALVLQVPTFHLEQLSPQTLTGNLATSGNELVIEFCDAEDLMLAHKWWNGTVGGHVSWCLDVERDNPIAKVGERKAPYWGEINLQASSGSGQLHAQRHLDTVRRVVEQGWRIRDVAGFDIDVEWVATDRLYCHQLRPVQHSFGTYRKSGELVREEDGQRFASGVAVFDSPASGVLFAPGSEQPSEPFFLVSETKRGDLPQPNSPLWNGCVGVVDPSLGSRLSHVAATLELPYIAVPELANRDNRAGPWTLREIPPRD